MSIRLSSSQVTKINEAILRFKRNEFSNNGYSHELPLHVRVEDLVEDIFRIVTPEVSEWLIDTSKIPNVPQNAKDSVKS